MENETDNLKSVSRFFLSTNTQKVLHISNFYPREHHRCTYYGIQYKRNMDDFSWFIRDSIWFISL